jgi:microcystin-dependent protein
MSTEPFIAEIKLFAFNFSPRGYALCQGQIMSIAQNTALFSLVGTTYGGNGQTTFGLPDLRGRVPIGQGQGPGLSNYQMGQVSGTENTTLLATNMPAHIHTLNCSTGAATSTSPTGNFNAATEENPSYGSSVGGNMHPNSIGVAGGSQPFSIMQPYLAMNYSIAVQGIFPSRN